MQLVILAGANTAKVNRTKHYWNQHNVATLLDRHKVTRADFKTLCTCKIPAQTLVLTASITNKWWAQAKLICRENEKASSLSKSCSCHNLISVGSLTYFLNRPKFTSVVEFWVWNLSLNWDLSSDYDATRLRQDWDPTEMRLGQDWGKTEMRLRQDWDHAEKRLRWDWDETRMRLRWD